SAWRAAAWPWRSRSGPFPTRASPASSSPNRRASASARSRWPGARKCWAYSANRSSARGGARSRRMAAGAPISLPGSEERRAARRSGAARLSRRPARLRAGHDGLEPHGSLVAGPLDGLALVLLDLRDDGGGGTDLPVRGRVQFAAVAREHLP